MAVYRVSRPRHEPRDDLGSALLNLSEAMGRARRRRQEEERYRIAEERAQRNEARAAESHQAMMEDRAERKEAQRVASEAAERERLEQAEIDTVRPEALNFVSDYRRGLEQQRLAGELTDVEYAERQGGADEALGSWLRERGVSENAVGILRTGVINEETEERDRVRREVRARAGEARAAEKYAREVSLRPQEDERARVALETAKINRDVARYSRLEAEQRQIDRTRDAAADEATANSDLAVESAANAFQGAFDELRTQMAADPNLSASDKVEMTEALVQRVLEDTEDLSAKDRSAIEKEVRTRTSGDQQTWLRMERERATKGAQHEVALAGFNRTRAVGSVVDAMGGTTPEEMTASLSDYVALRQRWVESGVSFTPEDQIGNDKRVLGAVVRELYADGLGEDAYRVWRKGGADAADLPIKHEALAWMTDDDIEAAFDEQRAIRAKEDKANQAALAVKREEEQRVQDAQVRSGFQQVIDGVPLGDVIQQMKEDGTSANAIWEVEQLHAKRLETTANALDADPVATARVGDWLVDADRAETPAELAQIEKDARQSLLSDLISPRQYEETRKAVAAEGARLAEPTTPGSLAARALERMVDENLTDIYIDKDETGKYVVFMPGTGRARLLDNRDDRDVQSFIRAMKVQLMADGEYEPGSMEDRIAHRMIENYISFKMEIRSPDPNIPAATEQEQHDRWLKVSERMIQDIRREGIAPGFKARLLAPRYVMFPEQNRVLRFYEDGPEEGQIDMTATGDALLEWAKVSGNGYDAPAQRRLEESVIQLYGLFNVLSAGQTKREPLKAIPPPGAQNAR